MAQEQREKSELIKDAQYRKGLSIAFFNATNAAIEMCKATSNVTVENFHHWRNLLIDEHNEYYAKIIATVGSPVDVPAAIKKLQATKTKPELTKVWMGFTEDERQHPEIKTMAYSLREQYIVPKTPDVVAPKVKKSKTK